MFYNYYRKDERTDNERYLEEQLEDARRREEERYEEEQRQYEQRRAESRQARENSRRTAESWPEALDKQMFLCRRESNQSAKLDQEYGLEPQPDDFFGPSADACEEALGYWREEEKDTAEKIASLQQQIAELRTGIALKVADRLEAHGGMRDGWYSVVGALREYDEDSLSEWLNW